MNLTLKPLPDELPAHIAQQLDGSLSALRAATQSLAPEPAMEAKLVAALRKRKRKSMLNWLTASGATALGIPSVALTLSLGFVGWMLLSTALIPQVQPAPSVANVAGSNAPFIALQSAARIALEPSATLISTTFPRALLASYGMPVAPERAGDQVRADMLIASNGQPLALRIIE